MRNRIRKIERHVTEQGKRACWMSKIDLVSEGKTDILNMVSGVFDIEQAAEAFEKLKNNDGTLAKLLIRF